MFTNVKFKQLTIQKTACINLLYCWDTVLHCIQICTCVFYSIMKHLPFPFRVLRKFLRNSKSSTFTSIIHVKKLSQKQHIQCTCAKCTFAKIFSLRSFTGRLKFVPVHHTYLWGVCCWLPSVVWNGTVFHQRNSRVGTCSTELEPRIHH